MAVVAVNAMWGPRCRHIDHGRSGALVLAMVRSGAGFQSRPLSRVVIGSDHER
jgi:hypothetical protein